MSVLYHCISTYHVLQAIVHRNLRHKNDYAVLVIADFTALKFADYTELCGLGFFDETVRLPYREIEHNPETVITSITQICEERLPQPIEAFTEIYVAAAHYYFSLYLIEKQIPFHFFEDGCGIISKPKVSYDIVKNYQAIQADIAQSYGMFDGDNPYVKDIICNVSAQSFPLTDGRVTDFDVVRELYSCGKELRENIFRLFRMEKTDLDFGNGAVVFTQQLANLGIVSFEEQICIYQIACDFFLHGKKLFFKVHPDDVMYYSLLFPESTILKGRYPAELMPFLSDRMAETSFTVFSSSVLSVRSGFSENIFCGYDFDKTFSKTELYFYALDVLRRLPIADYALCACGVDVTLCNNLIQYSLSPGNNLELHYPHRLCGADKKSVIIVDDPSFISDVFRNEARSTEFEFEPVEVTFSHPGTCPQKAVCAEAREQAAGAEESEYMPFTGRQVIKLLETLPEDDLVVFINSNKDYCFYDYNHRELFRQMVPVKVWRTKIRETEVYCDQNPFVLYFYTKNERMRTMISNYKNKKKLPCTGIQTEARTMTKDQQRIAILEGMLEATEKRLLRYIEKENSVHMETD